MDHDDAPLWRALVEAAAAGRRCALATVVETRGSTPRKAGTKMLVDPERGLVGTVGGGCGEAEVIVRYAEGTGGGSSLSDLRQVAAPDAEQLGGVAEAEHGVGIERGERREGREWPVCSGGGPGWPDQSFAGCRIGPEEQPRELGTVDVAFDPNADGPVHACRVRDDDGFGPLTRHCRAAPWRRSPPVSVCL